MSSRVYRPVAHLRGVSPPGLGLTDQLPWLYVITAAAQRLLYIGETAGQGGLAGRLGEHFGPFIRSTLRQRAEHFGFRRLIPPFVVFGAKFPSEEEGGIPFESNRSFRQLVEALAHEELARLLQSDGWTFISTPQPRLVHQREAVEGLAKAIVSSIHMSLSFVATLQYAESLQLVLLDVPPQRVDQPAPVSTLIEEIEVALASWVIGSLKLTLGEKWWSDGVPIEVRKNCMSRREEENATESAPPEAYLMLIELRQIIRANWATFGPKIEKCFDGQGKDKGTAWIVELNDVRKLVAHPLKMRHFAIGSAQETAVRDMHTRLRRAIQMAAIPTATA